MPQSISLTLNGKPTTLEADGNRKLLWVLRTDLGLTGAKYGCGAGHCGACMVLINNVPTRSCLTRLKQVSGKAVVTIEGLADHGKLHPLQQAFADHGALQCGFCTPGMIMAGCGLLAANPKPSTEQIVTALDGHLCRCGAHPRIIDAIHAAAEQMKGGKAP